MDMQWREWDAQRDFAATRDLVARIYAHSGPPAYATVGDLEWWRVTDDEPQGPTRAHLAWSATGELVGFAWPSGGQVDIIVMPGQPEVVVGLLAWAEERRRVLTGAAAVPAPASAPAPVTLTAWAFRHAAAAQTQDLLRERIYAPGQADDDLHIRVRTLDGQLPQPSLPEGYELRALRGADECEARAAAQRDAFGSQRMTADRYQQVLRTDTYRNDLDLVVIAPDGEVAAFTTIWLDAANHQGTFEPVGVRVAHQRRGLARALMFAGFQRLRAHGATHASLTSEGSNAGAARLYDSVGMPVCGALQSWTKVL